MGCERHSTPSICLPEPTEKDSLSWVQPGLEGIPGEIKKELVFICLTAENRTAAGRINIVKVPSFSHSQFFLDRTSVTCPETNLRPSEIPLINADII